MKRLFKTIAIALAGAAMLVSCSKDQMGVTYTPAEGDGLFTFNATGTAAFEFGPESPNMTIELYRSVADAEATVSVTSTQMLGETPVSVLNVPAEATFEAGSHTAHVTITYNENLRADNTYSISLSIPAEQTSLGGNSTIAFNASMAYVWESLGTNGQFYDNMGGLIVPVEVLLATNSSVPNSRYRIMNPYPAEAQAAIAAGVGASVGGPVSEYIEFVVDPETGYLTWSGYWNCGVLVDPTLSFSHLNYWFGTESPFAGATEFPKECGMMMEGIFQFKPHVSAFANEEQSSGWTIGSAYEYLALPGYDLSAIGL